MTIPPPKPVRDLLLAELDHKVALRLADPYAPGPDEPVTYAVYVDGSLRTHAVVTADLSFSVYAGAAASMVPPGGAAVALAEGRPSALMREKLHTLFESCADVLAGTPRLRLYDVYFPGTPPPSDVVTFGCALGQRLDLEVDVAGYGAGRFSIVGVAV